MKLRSFAAAAAAGVIILAAAAPVAGFTGPGSAKIAPYTAESGHPMSETRKAMETPHLGLSLRVDPKRKAISGVARYTVRAAAPLTSVEFDLDPRFRISRISVNDAVLPASAWENQGGKLVIALPAPLAEGGEAIVEIAYAGRPRVAPRAPWDGGIVWGKTPQGQPWIATAVQGTGCDLFWPCLDHPQKRVGVLDFVVTVPAPLVDASNGTLVGMTEEDGWRSYHWRAKWPNDYGVSLQIGPYDLIEESYASRFGNAIPIMFWHLPGNGEGARRLVAEMRTYLDFFESTIGPYPFGDEKVGVAETPHKGMEHQTVNAYGNKYVFAAEGYDELMQHEFAHEWFANQLSNARNADLWLQEGFGTYMQPLYLEWQGKHLAAQAALWNMRKGVISRVPVAPVEDVPTSLYDDREKGWGRDIYGKGALIAHTLRGLVGDEAFFASLKRLVYGRPDPAPGNFRPVTASTDDFRHIVEAESGLELGWFFDAYLRQAALPRLIVTQQGRTLDLKWETPAETPFAMPLDVEVAGSTVTVPMTGGQGTLELPEAGTHYRIDPLARVLRHDAAIDAWREQEDAKAKADGKQS